MYVYIKSEQQLWTVTKVEYPEIANKGRRPDCPLKLVEDKEVEP